MTEEAYVLKWNSHNTELISEFHDLCRFELFTDVTLAADGESFEAHKLVLSACSPYFRSLFAKNPCKHPIVFLKDIPGEHIAILLKYMYLGEISVRKEDLNEILHTANSLRIRGLTTESDSYDRVLPAASEALASESKRRTDSGSVKGGRKASRPMKLGSHHRLSMDRESLVSSPRSMPETMAMQDNQHMESEQAMGVPHGGGTPESRPDDDHEGGAMDLSQPGGSTASKFSILGNYLKTGKVQHRSNGSVDDYQESGASTTTTDRSASTPPSQLASSWLETSLASLQTAEMEKLKQAMESAAAGVAAAAAGQNNNSNAAALSLKETLGIDIADRLRSHFLANLPPESYAWLNQNGGAGPSTNNGRGNGASTSSANGNEVGPNGKPSVACEICGKRLADPSSLYRHRKIHSGDKPHKCPYCSRRFIQRYNMKQHIKTHRLERLERPEVVAREFPDLVEVKPKADAALAV